jgi:hypothetical protein
MIFLGYAKKWDLPEGAGICRQSRLRPTAPSVWVGIGPGLIECAVSGHLGSLLRRARAGQAAAELLVPTRELRELWREVGNEPNASERAARHFKVSPIVAGRRAKVLRLVSRDTFFAFYNAYTKQRRVVRQPEQPGRR